VEGWWGPTINAGVGPADWARLDRDLPKLTQVCREELSFAREALRCLRAETVTRRFAEEQHDEPEEGVG